jgi:hypothetical protein
MSQPPPPAAPPPAEAWLRGPVPGVDPFLWPAAHALIQAREELPRLLEGLPVQQLWARPGGAASIGFHALHAAGALERLCTYARGEALTPAQAQAAAAEKQANDGGLGAQPAGSDAMSPQGVSSQGSSAGIHSRREPPNAEALAARLDAAVEAALAQLRATPREQLLEPRAVGRQKLPSSVLGLLFHAAEHTTRHLGQIATTARVVRTR